MLRVVYPISPGILVTCIVFVSSHVAYAQHDYLFRSKQIYSNRAVGYKLPTVYYGTPQFPRFTTPPRLPFRNVQTVYPGTMTPNTQGYGIAVPRLTASDVEPSIDASNIELDTVAARSVTARQLAGKPVENQPAPIFPTCSEPNMIEKMIVVRDQQPVVKAEDELDSFYARLAKIELERHQLDESLNLVQKIKSETFKVRTIIDLAEYVSRDRNYRSEAEQLFQLAIDGTDALNRKQPFRVDAHSPNSPQHLQLESNLPKPIIQTVPAQSEPIVQPESTQPTPTRRPPLLLDGSVNNAEGEESIETTTPVAISPTPDSTHTLLPDESGIQQTTAPIAVPLTDKQETHTTPALATQSTTGQIPLAAPGNGTGTRRVRPIIALPEN